MDEGIQAFINFLGLPDKRPLVAVVKPIESDIEKHLYEIDPRSDDQVFFSYRRTSKATRSDFTSQKPR